MQKSCDVFCNVIDNYGDIGIAWRLARQLSAEHGFAVRLWVDDLTAFHRIWPAVEPGAETQAVEGVDVCAWCDPFAPARPAQVVIEAFGCTLPERYLQAMASCSPAPVWINLEYLSAEPWVRDHHGLPSPHPRLPLTKHFFFPGYAPGTGGLLRERDLIDRRDGFQRREREAFLGRLGAPLPTSDSLCVSLFAYENTALAGLLDAWSEGGEPVVCLVPEGRVLPAVAAWEGRSTLVPGDRFQRGRLVLHVLPFLVQDDYDRLLWASDVNFVRGEDSCVRAQWAARPMVWQAYAQVGDAHWHKVEALLERYVSGLPGPAAAALAKLWRAWNGIGQDADAGRVWGDFLAQREALAVHAGNWCRQHLALADLAGNLVDFIENRL